LTFTPKAILQYLNVGRVVKIKDGETNWGYGYVINFHKKDKSKKKSDDANDSVFYVADIMVHVKKEKVSDKVEPIPYQEEGEMTVLTFLLSCIC
jgi:ATP-dependent RNA helicase DOB1